MANFVSLIVDGRIIDWKKPNTPHGMEEARKKASGFIASGKSAFPVIVEEATPVRGRPRKDNINRKVVSAYLPDDIIEELKRKAEENGGRPISAEIAAIVEEAIRRCKRA